MKEIPITLPTPLCCRSFYKLIKDRLRASAPVPVGERRSIPPTATSRRSGAPVINFPEMTSRLIPRSELLIWWYCVRCNEIIDERYYMGCVSWYIPFGARLFFFLEKVMQTTALYVQTNKAPAVSICYARSSKQHNPLFCTERKFDEEIDRTRFNAPCYFTFYVCWSLQHQRGVSHAISSRFDIYRFLGNW